ncbi:MAG: zinc ribbon domain-containing protein [Verrucomicrobiota bacterium]
MAPETSPNCGADVPKHARACPECGACDETGWSDDVASSSADIPDDSFDYNEFVKREFGPKRVLPRGITWVWWGISLGLAGLLLFWMLR